MRVVAFLTLLLAGCVGSLGKDKLDLSEAVDAKKAKIVSAKPTNHLISYKEGRSKRQVQWFGCELSGKAKGSFVVVNPDGRAFSSKATCQDWLPQAFLNKGYHVIAVNRPGYGKSTPIRRDFGGPASLAAVRAAIEYAKRKSAELGRVTGGWGYGSGAIAAAFASKAEGGFAALILGGGIYDLEQFHTESKGGPVKEALDKAIGKEAAEFFEPRSISWDSEGVAKKVVIYHAQEDKAVPVEQAKTFFDVLKSSQIDAELELLEGIGHDLSAAKHRYVLSLMLNKL